jgi:sirohydrochlorin cobaltochelatase
MTTAGAAKNAPMSSAPMRYRPDGSVDWGNMWDTFCSLAQDGGPPHRGTMLNAPPVIDVEDPVYRRAAREIIRGIDEVSGLTALAAEPGWIAIRCLSASMARWLAEAIVQENVQVRCDGERVFLPVAADYAVEREVKNVITVVAKTTHYWQDHLRREVTQSLPRDDTPRQPEGRPICWIGRRW